MSSSIPVRVFMTGGAGYVGSHIVRELTAAGHMVTVLARDPLKARPLRDLFGATLVQGDLERIEEVLPHVDAHDACIHNAILWDDVRGEIELKDVRVSARLFDAALQAGVQKLVYTSSTAVHRPFLKTPMDETQRIETADLYGATKASAELFLWALASESQMNCNVIRPGPVVGSPAYDGGPFRLDRRFAAIIDKARAGEDIEVARGDGRQFIAAADLAKLYRALLESDRSHQTYVAVAEEVVTWGEIARRIIRCTGSKSGIQLRDAQATPIFDVGKMAREFGFRFSALEAIASHIEFACQRGSFLRQ